MRPVVLSLTLLMVCALPASAQRGSHASHSSHSGSSHSSPSHSTSRSSIEHVHGYTTKSGTQVGSYDRTSPNHTRNDNWSTKGNVNPETGKAGTKPRDP